LDSRRTLASYRQASFGPRWLPASRAQRHVSDMVDRQSPRGPNSRAALISKPFVVMYYREDAYMQTDKDGSSEIAPLKTTAGSFGRWGIPRFHIEPSMPLL
ncbi:1096_t:CDS:2, partial [Acaulospora colombiana]